MPHFSFIKELEKAHLSVAVKAVANVAVTQNRYIKTVDADAAAAMQHFEQSLQYAPFGRAETATDVAGRKRKTGKRLCGRALKHLAEREGFEPSVQVLARTTV
jgi:hypothetical protein